MSNEGFERGGLHRGRFIDNRDKSISKTNHFEWRGDHKRMGCNRGCVSPSSHFSKWWNVYSRDIEILYGLVSTRIKLNIPKDSFVDFAYSYSSGYFPSI